MASMNARKSLDLWKLAQLSKAERSPAEQPSHCNRTEVCGRFGAVLLALVLPREEPTLPRTTTRRQTAHVARVVVTLPGNRGRNW